MLFVITQQIELDTYLPIAIELKERSKKKVGFLFTTKKNYLVMSKSPTLFNALKKIDKIFYPDDNKLKVIKWIFNTNCKAVFFPSFGHSTSNVFLNFFLKIFKVKKVLLWRFRMVDEAVPVLKKIRTINIPKESKFFFNLYVYYHSKQIDLLENIKKRKLDNNNNLVKIGIPSEANAWKKFLKNEEKKELIKLNKKFGVISNVYTIIGVKGFTIKQIIGHKSKTSKYLNLLVKEIFRLDPKAIILYKPHPRDEKPAEVFNFFDYSSYPRFTFSYLHTDVLAKISKLFFFVQTNNILTTASGILKINCVLTNRKYKKLMQNIKFESGYGDIRLDYNKNWKSKLKKILFDKNLFKKEYFRSENDLIANNKFYLNKLLKKICQKNQKK